MYVQKNDQFFKKNYLSPYNFKHIQNSILTIHCIYIQNFLNFT